MEKENLNRSLITHYDPKSPVSEAFRTLRTNLQFAGLDREIRCILVTSSGPEEGKSTIASNLAIAMAQSGKKTLLIDADLRRPTAHKRLNLDNSAGLTTLIVNGINPSFIQQSEIPGLDVVTSGPLPPNPSEMLAASAMDKLIAHFKENYDMVIFDCPPVIAVTDAAVLAPKLDGVVLVVRLGTADRNIVKRAKTLLENVQARILGVVVNGIDAGNSGSYYYYYYYYYESNESETAAGAENYD